MKPRYLTVTTMVTDQTISDTTPMTFSGLGGTPCRECRHSCKV
jgi:hypothetical protein